MKRHSIFFLCLLLVVGIVSMLGIPIDAQAVESVAGIRIYVNPDVVPSFADAGYPTAVQTGQSSIRGHPWATGPYVKLGTSHGTVSGGTEITDSNDHDSASPVTAGGGDIIAIALHLQNVDLWYLTLNFPGFDAAGLGRPAAHTTNPNRIKQSPPPNVYLEGPPGNAGLSPALADATAVYFYRVKNGDVDTDGGWLDSAAMATPFSNNRWGSSAKKAITFDTRNVKYPRVDGVGPELAPIHTHPVRFSDSSGYPIDNAPRGGHSRYHEIREHCIAHSLLRGSSYTSVCAHVMEDGYSKPALADSRQVYYYGLGDTIYYSVRFDKAVTVDAATPPTLRLGGGTLVGKYADYHSGAGTDTLVFRYTVEAGDYRFSDLQLYSALRHNAYNRGQLWPEDDPNAKWIRDLGGNRFLQRWADTQSALMAYFIGEMSETDWTYGGASGFHYNHILWSGDETIRALPGSEASKVRNFIVDTLPATVWIPGLIKNGETHTDDKRTAIVSLDAAAAPVTDFDLGVTESTTQTATFDVEFRFFNHPDAKSAVADEVGESFQPADVSITGPGVTRDAWQVALTYVGLDHRATERWPPSPHWTESLSEDSTSARERHIARHPGEIASEHEILRDYPALAFPLGSAKNSASFLVYKATITPPFGFVGDVTIALPAGATMDIAGNASLASNTLTVPVDNPLRVVETPEIVEPPAGVYTAGDKIEVSVTYAQENLRYEGANPPYLVVYLGEQVLANARHAVWTAAAGTDSTKVTFAYTVAATDTVTDAVRAPSVEILVPEETTLLSGPLGAPDGQQVGTAVPAVASGAAPASVPELDPVEDTSGREVAPVVRKTPVIPVVPFFPEAASPKAAASAVPRSPIVFNEFGNGSGAANDWLELRNVTGSAVSLKDWELSVVQDDKKEDTSLVVFADVSVPANGLLLLVSTSPAKTSLAGGDDIATSAVEQKGSPHQYLVVSGLALPDDGQFLLILRNAKEKLGMNEAFVDVAGGGGSDTDAFVREQTGDYDTYVWPLQVLQAPGGDTEGALGSGKVWQRAKADIVGYHKDAWAEAAFTGIGYDRNVSKSAATAGTPGYPNGAVKTGAATPKGSITISEVMFDSGGGTLPQWIELYNKSKTEALNLNRWELEFQNVDSEELVGRPIVALTLQEKVIQPNQTLLIVAGPARASSSTVFPAERVYNLLDLHQRNLRIKTARDTFLSAEGFYLKLTDSNGNLVDEVGNTDGNRRTKDAPAWALPVSAEEGVRSSLIRRYDNGVARKGKQRASWALASNVKRLAVSELHYGHAEDIGTPGYRAGGALPVELSSFSVMHNEAGAVVLTWTTESEVDNAGFNLRRSEKRTSGFTLLNAALIAGAGTTGERQTYTYTDTSAKPGVEYYYQIEEVAFDGRPVTLATRMLRGPVSAANRQLTTFGAVKKQAK